MHRCCNVANGFDTSPVLVSVLLHFSIVSWIRKDCLGGIIPIFKVSAEVVTL